MVACPTKLKDEIPAFLDQEDGFRLYRTGEYRLESWRKYFGDNPFFADYVTRNPEPISRQDFADVRNLHADPAARAEQVFLLAMMWGYSDRGYGAYRTQQMLSSPAAVEHIHLAVNLVAQGKVADAYRASRLYLCGPAYISKFL